MRTVRQTAWYTFAHLATDFACGFFLFRAQIPASRWALCFLLYNFAAFAMQMPLGLVCDRWNRNALAAALGLLLTAAGCLLGKTPLLLAAVIGMGNALFHLGGGLDVMNAGGRKAGALGVFVSSGAIGLFLGVSLGKSAHVPTGAVGVFLLAVAVLTPVLVLGKRVTAPSGNAGLSLPEHPSRACGAAALLLLVVVLRSYLGMNAAFPWKTGAWAAGAVLACALGKAAGGFVADALGLRLASVVQLVTAAALFLCSETPVCGLLALFFFNMTMPVTLFAVSRTFAGMKGFAFGLLTFGLFLGFLPSVLGWRAPLSAPWGLALITAASLALLLWAFRTEARDA